jgi:nucleotide-binding universal stress UspA family protein
VDLVTKARIVVGVDGSQGCAAALAWAAGQARATGAALQLVAAWTRPMAFGKDARIEDDYWDDLATRAIEQAVQETGLVGLEVDRLVVRANPVTALLEASREADLLVVGSHGHEGFPGAVLGSVCRNLSGHATCPLVIVRPATGRSGGRG